MLDTVLCALGLSEGKLVIHDTIGEFVGNTTHSNSATVVADPVALVDTPVMSDGNRYSRTLTVYNLVGASGGG